MILQVKMLNFFIITSAIAIYTVNCVPTSILVNSKEFLAKQNNLKVKRSSSSDKNSNGSLLAKEKSTTTFPILSSSLSSSSPSEVVAENKAENPKFLLKNFDQLKLSALQKRGINSQLMYGDNPLVSTSSNEIWSDEFDSPLNPYQDWPEIDYFSRNGEMYRSKPVNYGNIPSLLNAEGYSSGGLILPHLQQYPYRYYGNRRKRSNNNKKNYFYNMRLKRDSTSKLTPADMLALIALVEAGERSRQKPEMDGDEDESIMFNNNAYPIRAPYSLPLYSTTNRNGYNSGNEYNNWADPMEYYDMPYGLDNLPRYDIINDQKLSNFPFKQYPEKKKKRSINFKQEQRLPLTSFMNEDNLYGSNDHLVSDNFFEKGLRRYQKHF